MSLQSLTPEGQKVNKNKSILVYMSSSLAGQILETVKGQTCLDLSAEALSLL